MTAQVRIADPRSADGTALLHASHALMQSLYPPEANHFLSIDALCAPHVRFFIADFADFAGVAVGCAALADHRDYGEVKSMFVAPDARGSGAGAALMQMIESAARDAGLPVLKLETGDDLYAAHRLYQRHGFAVCGPFGDYTEGPHSVFMEKPL